MLRNRFDKAGWVALAAAAIAVCLSGQPRLLAAEPPAILPAPRIDDAPAPGAGQTAVLSAGCFWGVQGVYQHVRGVRRVVAGYAGGARATADYELVSSGTTGHAESVRISFDPSQISYGKILQIAFSVVHDPTQLDRQGPDAGTQYRSAIFYGNERQKHIAEAYIAQLTEAHAFARPIATRVESLKGFYEAESYHQDYLIHHPNDPYIVFNDRPKLENFERTFPELYNGRPVMARNQGP